MAWTSMDAYAHGDGGYRDAFLLDCVAPAASDAVSTGQAASWFFIRYWHGGPHIRLRLRDATPGAAAAVGDRMRGWLAGHPADPVDPERFYGDRGTVASHGWQPHGTVVPGTYEPETDRYGGPAAIDAAERLFVDSTQVAVAALTASRAPGRRLGVAMNLLTAYTASVCDTPAAEIALLRRYVFGARYGTETGPGDTAYRARVAAEADYAERGDAYRSAADKVRAAVADESARAGYPGFWARRAGGYAATLRALAEAGELTGPGGAWTVLLSQLHMLHNRMGVELTEEYHLSWLASLVRAGASTGGDGYHDGGPDSPARRYHERSKYLAGASDQLPRPHPAPPPGPAGDPGVGLPEPSALVHARLDDVLARRRSHLGDLHGKVEAADLSAILTHAAGERTVPVPRPAGEPLRVPVRPYPTAGALGTTRLLVWPARVPTIEPALYAYEPAAHRLRRVAPAPDPARLAACSPYFDEASDLSIPVAGVPLWLFAVGDISRLTDRYGLRAYRFLLIEIGHLVQNLALVSTALDYRVTTIGAFYDDAGNQLLELDGVNESVFSIIPVGR